MLLIRIHLIRLVFVCFIAGIFFYEYIPLTVPLRHEIHKGPILTIVIVAFLAFLFGEKLRGSVRLSQDKLMPSVKTQNNPQMGFVFGLLFFVIFFIFASTLYVERGIPLFMEGAKAAGVKTFLNVATFGRTRCIDIFLPVLSLYLYALSRRYSQRKHVRLLAFLSILAALSLLLAKLGKGNVLWFLLGIAYVRSNYDKSNKTISRRSIILVLCAITVIAMVFLLTEGRNLAFTFLYLANRVFVYSWEGFSFIVATKMKPDISQQLAAFCSLSPASSPGIELAKSLLGRDQVSFAIVPTLFGFLYRNGGFPAIICGFVIMGYLVRSLLIAISRNLDNILLTIIYYYLYIMLLKIILVGNVFNELRGHFLSVITIYLIIQLPLSFGALVARNDNLSNKGADFVNYS